MADITWPDGLHGPLISNFSREETVGFIESELASGPSFITPLSDDTPSFHSMTFQFKRGDARRFQQFLRVNSMKLYSPWFNMPLVTEDRSIEYQEARFTASGYPQLASVTSGGIHTYNAQVITRSIETTDEDYPTELDAIWGVNCGNVNLGNSLLDEGLNFDD